MVRRGAVPVAGMASLQRGFVSRTAMAYRDDLIALSARHDALATEVVQKTRELEDSRRLLEQARARAKLPVLRRCVRTWREAFDATWLANGESVAALDNRVRRTLAEQLNAADTSFIERKRLLKKRR